jgi:uncharacterized protein
MVSSWKATIKKGFTCKNPVFIEGLPGIGNVGKLVVDYMVDTLGAEKIGSFFSYDLPNSVFVVQDGSVQLPSIDLYHMNRNGQDFLLLAGDAQPSQERASYELTHELLVFAKQFGCKKIVALGGIGLPEQPSDPRLFIASNDKKFAKEFKKHGVSNDIFGVVGPIVGVSGLLLGLSQQHKIPAVSLLGETFGHPLYIGIKESRLMLEVLNKQFNLGVDFKELDDEIKYIDEEISQDDVFDSSNAVKKVRRQKPAKDTNYIG